MKKIRQTFYSKIFKLNCHIIMLFKFRVTSIVIIRTHVIRNDKITQKFYMEKFTFNCQTIQFLHSKKLSMNSLVYIMTHL